MRGGVSAVFVPVDLLLTKALFTLDPDKPANCFLGLGALFRCSFFFFFCPFDQTIMKTLQMVHVAPFR